MKEQYTYFRERTKEFENRLKSGSVCLAKWYHSNIYLQTGETHSCYHPSPHSIDVKKIADNPGALHNTEQKMAERRAMLNGEKPAGCQYCWNIEKLGESFISDRHIRTGSLFAEHRVEAVATHKEFPDVIPDYIEVSFGNECNFRCGYCHPKASSRYYNEIKQHGPYSSVVNHRCDIDWFKIYSEDDNPYLTAWWKWWDQIQDQVKILRVTGGEPLIQKSTYRLLESFVQNPKPALELNINSNLGSSFEIIKKFCSTVQERVQSGSVKQFKLFTSMDTWGPQAEYIRNGLKIDLFERNLEHYLQSTQSPVTFMMTFNLFSVPNFDILLKKILEWRRKFPWERQDQFHRIRFDISYLKEPLQYDMNILPKEFALPYMERHLQFIQENLNDSSKESFSYLEYENFRRVVEYLRTTNYADDKIQEGRKDFWNFFNEQDRRRQTDFQATFPEMSAFFELCKETARSQS